MVAPENTNWLYDCGIENMVNFAAPNNGLSWPPRALNGSSNVGKDRTIETESKKRTRADACTPSSSKACREKQRRDRLNDRFMDLAALLEPGQPLKADKSAILVDAVRIIGQLKGEAHKLRNSNSNLQEKIKELKKEKTELRDKKHKSIAEKEKLVQRLKSMRVPEPYLVPEPPPIPAAYATASQAACKKLMPVISYSSGAMWQFMARTAVDTSQDHVLRPPVA